MAFDGSIHAEKALAEAIDLARTQRACLTILTAVPHPPATVAYAGLSPSALEADAEAESQAILRRAKETVPADVPVTTILTRKAAPDALVQQVD